MLRTVIVDSVQKLRVRLLLFGNSFTNCSRVEEKFCHRQFGRRRGESVAVFEKNRCDLRSVHQSKRRKPLMPRVVGLSLPGQ